MPQIFDLWHYKIGYGTQPSKNIEEESGKLLGHYTSLVKAELAIRQHQGELGFRDWPDGFRIHKIQIDNEFSEPMAGPLLRIFSLWHFCIGRDEQEEYDEPTQVPTDLGMFSSEVNARREMERRRQETAFRDYPDGFRFGSAPPDIDYWEGGFVSWDDA